MCENLLEFRLEKSAKSRLYNCCCKWRNKRRLFTSTHKCVGQKVIRFFAPFLILFKAKTSIFKKFLDLLYVMYYTFYVNYKITKEKL